jgi:hypothetical protein
MTKVRVDHEDVFIAKTYHIENQVINQIPTKVIIQDSIQTVLNG